MIGPLRSVLIANRGEIACRIIRAARRLELRTIAIYSDADAGSLAVEMADEAIRIGPSAPGESYLAGERIVAAARASGADCIHPGYGFLSERPTFARLCAENGIVFIGPPASAIEAMGLKDSAKALVAAAGVPVTPGYHGPEQGPDFLRARADEIGYPALIKAVAGGGGKGMKRVDRSDDFAAALDSARREASGAFGDDRVLIEKYISAPRHVEIQILADSHGNVVHLFERDCSLQRRHQKVIEEAPAPGMNPAMREAMGRAAVEAARAVGYIGAGTIEFIVDSTHGLSEEKFWFMEMNARLQVEHPVTEAITGLDLVEWQFRVAAGERLGFTRDDLVIKGHAVEARLYAEDPEHGFLPSTGKLWALCLPESARVDTGVRAGDEITPFYDPMIAKIIAHAPTREEALDRLDAALAATLVAGPRTNLAFLRALCGAPGFRSGAFDTGFIDRHLAELGAVPRPPDPAAIAAGATALAREWAAELNRVARPDAPATLGGWSADDGFQLVGARDTGFPVLIDGDRVVTRLAPSPAGLVARAPGASEAAPAPETKIIPTDRGVIVARAGRQTRVERFDPLSVDIDHLDSGGSVKAPMHGKVVAVFVGENDSVAKGDRLAIVEAMKMEHVLVAPFDGVATEVAAEPGAQVAEGARLMTIAART